MIPEWVWKGFNSWYGPSLPIIKKVIKYKKTKELKAKIKDGSLIWETQDFIYELEVDEILL